MLEELEPEIQYDISPPDFPSLWMSAYGEDRKAGFWMAIEINGVEQRFRWIHPGTFMMGSPQSERDKIVDENAREWARDEARHIVTLTEGLWLAETTVTQELWQAVMGNTIELDKIIRFQGSQRPIDQVSWDDCQAIIKAINSLEPEFELRLPTEAEWEYACRAGTTTPFSFGETIATDQANYNGHYPYGDSEKGQHRAETVEVGSLPSNPWGLYEMHGNVWEWCEDIYGDYPDDHVINPQGVATGDSTESERRVLRGGSWNGDAHSARSARRGIDPPDDRFDIGSRGFRLARGLIPSGQDKNK